MKRYLAIACALLVSCSQTTDPEKDKQAIKEVLKAETQAWVDKDVAKAKGFYVQDSLNTRFEVDDSTYVIIKGWDSLSKNLDGIFAGDRTGLTHFKADKEFITIKIMDNSAWVACRETNTFEMNNVPRKFVRLQMLVMQKIDGAWKISSFMHANTHQH